MEPSALTDQDLVDVRDYGWSDRVIADVVGLVVLNQLTGSFNLVAGLRPDAVLGDDRARFRAPPDQAGTPRAPSGRLETSA